jgi:hypothetical protein
MTLFEIHDQSLTVKRWQQLTAKEREFYSIRDNCGPAALDFIEWA